MVLATVDCFVPEEVGCLAWSQHCQLALCTPKYIHLVSRGGDGAVLRGYIRCEDVFAPVAAEKSSPKEEPWRVSRSGFRQACWWPRRSSTLDWLVAIDYLGRIAVLECMAIDVYRGGSWRPLWVPALEALVDSGVDFLAVSRDGQLVLATRNGLVHTMSDGGKTRSVALPLDANETVVSVQPVDPSMLIVGSTRGKILWVHNGEAHLLIDDGILQVGPVFQPSSGRLILAKFNRLYFATIQGAAGDVLPSVVDQMEIKGLLQPISSLMPVRNAPHLVLAVSVGQAVFEIDPGAKSFRCILEVPWHVEEDDLEPIGEGEGDGGSDEEGDEGEMAAEEAGSQLETSSSDASHRLFHQALLIRDGSFAWICETSKRTPPAVAKSRLFLYRLGTEESATVFRSAASHGGRSLPRLHEEMTTKCPDCALSLSMISDKDLGPSQLCVCANGHVYEVCGISGEPIPHLADIRQCLGCRGRFSSAAVPSCCPRCSCDVLPLFPGPSLG